MTPRAGDLTGVVPESGAVVTACVPAAASRPQRYPELEPALAPLVAAVESDVPLARRFPARWLALDLLAEADFDVPPAVLHAAATARREVAERAGDDDLETLVMEARYVWAHRVAASCVSRDRHALAATGSDRIDRWTTSRWFGLPIALAVLWTLFVLTTTVAAPLKNALAWLVGGPLTAAAKGLLSGVGLGHGAVESFVVDGLLGGVGVVLTFVPVMALMYLGLTLLEESGYLARVAFVMDRPLRRLGLPGRAFLPLLVGFGCNVPALAGTRILAGRDRVLTALLVPYVTCSARLPVYVMLAGIFFPGADGTVIFGLYLASVCMVLAVGALLSRTVLRSADRTPFVLELPPYHAPAIGATWRQVSGRTRAFLRSAGGIILVAVIAVWLLGAVPVRGGHAFGAVPLRDSAFGAVASTVAPVLSPAGFGDVHAAGALLTGVVAKEAVITSMAQTHGTAQPLDAAVRTAFTTSSRGHPQAAALAFLLFVLVYTPCLASVTAQRGELGLPWTMFGVALQTVLAYVVATAAFILLRLVV